MVQTRHQTRCDSNRRVETRIGVTSAAHSSRLKGRLAGMPVDDSVNGRSAAGQPANYHIDANRDRLSAERPFEPFCGAD